MVASTGLLALGLTAVAPTAQAVENNHYRWNLNDQLQQGHVGGEVFALQAALWGYGFGPGDPQDWPTGTFAAGTTIFVKQFQQSRGLTQDGIVGPNTWSALQTGIYYINTWPNHPSLQIRLNSSYYASFDYSHYPAVPACLWTADLFRPAISSWPNAQEAYWRFTRNVYAQWNPNFKSNDRYCNATD